MAKRICLHKLHRTLLIDKSVLNWNWEKKWRHYFMRMKFSRSIIYTWVRRKRVCKWVWVLTLIYTWDDQTWVIICKVITGLELFIRFGLFLKVVHFVENNIWPNCQEQPIFYIIVKISYYDLLGNNKNNLIKRGKNN